VKPQMNPDVRMDKRKPPQSAVPDDIVPTLLDLMNALRSTNGVRRQSARHELVSIGRQAVPFLVGALLDADFRVRWEAAKALVSIADPRSGPGLVRALRDDCLEVQWLAAEGLIALGKSAILPLLKALRDDSDSILLRQGAHHVLHDLERKHLLDEKTAYVLETLRSLEPETLVAVAAHHALASRGES
jgi:HEAT repeat protein